ncbi:response regulator [Luteibacter yeojuensis]|uniref:Response regulator n=1 Tax=Luteibacter yeojuensis TaxID=345309 RepID=A0A7X5QXJ5_9GAMM|nr:response regulator [Luteibacter yeojuensis]
MIRVVIADDEAPAREKIARWLSEQPDISVVAAAEDGLAAAQAIAKEQPDVAFLDVQMPALSGLQVAAQLDAATAPLIVFVTAFDEHAVRAFDLNAVDYLLKPYDQERLLRTLERVRSRVAAHDVGTAAVAVGRAQAPPCERLLVPDGERLHLLDAATVDWLEADDNYVHVHTASRRYMLRRTLMDLLAQLGEERFVRIHRSAAVNIGAIGSLTPLFKGDHELHLRNGTTLRLSRRYRDAFFARMGQ